MVPEAVLEAFRLQGGPHRLPGGEERTYRAGDAVVRRENAHDVRDAEFAERLFDGIAPSPEFRARLDEYRPSIDTVRARLAR